MSERMAMIVRELEALRDEDGKIVPSACVEWARQNRKSGLHAHLLWDNDEAAERYRLVQVRNLLQVHVVDPQGYRRFVSLSIDRTNGGGYRAVADVAKSRDLRAIMLEDALGDLERLQRLYHGLAELAPVWALVSKLRPRKLAA